MKSSMEIKLSVLVLFVKKKMLLKPSKIVFKLIPYCFKAQAHI